MPPAPDTDHRLRRRRLRRPALVALALVATVVAATGCDPKPYTTHFAQNPRIAVVGDSLTDQISQRETDMLVGDGWNASVTGIWGFTVAEQFDMLTKTAASRPQVQVIALGTNDLRKIDLGEQTWDGFRADVAHALNIVRDVPCVVWVGVTESAGSFPNGTRLSSAGWAINWFAGGALSSARPAAGTSVWADWATASKGHLEYFNSSEDMHLTPTGQEAYARLIRDAVRKCPGNPILGAVDQVSGGKGQITVAGWVADPDAASTQVHVYTDGRWTGALVADRSRPDVKAAYPRFSGANGFYQTFAMTPGRHQVCLYAINQGPPADNPLMDCRTVSVS